MAALWCGLLCSISTVCAVILTKRILNRRMCILRNKVDVVDVLWCGLLNEWLADNVHGAIYSLSNFLSVAGVICM